MIESLTMRLSDVRIPKNAHADVASVRFVLFE
jgi:hypothetical protein